MDTIYVILIAVAALLIGVACGYFIFLKVIKGRYNDIVDAATKEAEVIKEKKLLEVKEKFLNKKSDHIIALMTLIEIALRYEKELAKNDTTPYDNILSQLTSEIEEALKDEK